MGDANQPNPATPAAPIPAQTKKPSVFLQVLGNIALIGATLGPEFITSPHGTAILSASENLLIAELQSGLL